MRKLLIILAILCLGLGSCDNFIFEPTGENFVDVDATPRPLAVSWNQSQDTLGVWDEIAINYSFDTHEEADPLQVFLFLGDSLVSEAEYGTALTFNSSSFTDGIYPVYLVAAATSGTNSLAETLGSETVITVDSSKYFWIDNAPMDPVSVTDFTLRSDGALQIEWEKYQRPRFGGYRILETHFCLSECLQTLVPSADSTKWMDYSFDGHTRAYAIEIVDTKERGQTFHRGSSKMFQTSRTPSRFTKIERKDLTTISLAWEKTSYPHAFHGYRILRADNGIGTSGKKWFSMINDSDQTEAAISAPLGSNEYYFLNVYSQDINYGTPYAQRPDTTRILMGSKLPDDISYIQMMAYDQDAQQYIIFAQGRLLKINAQTMAIEASKDVGRYIDFVYSLSRQNFVVSVNSQIKVFDLSSFSLIKTIDLVPLYPDISSPRVKELSLSDNGILWYRKAKYHSPTTYYRGVGAIDLSTESLIDSLHFEDPNNFYKSVHHDGTFFYGNIAEKSGFAMYRYEQNEIKTVFTTEGNKFISVTPGGQNYYEFQYTFDDVTMIITTLDDNSIIWEGTLPAKLYSFSIDYEANTFSYIDQTTDEIITRHFSDASIVEQIDKSDFSIKDGFSVNHELVWWESGIYEPLNKLRSHE